MSLSDLLGRLRRQPGTAPQRFIIVAQARSGSTFLRETLHAQPEVVCHGEVLSRAWINKLVAPDGTQLVPRAEVEAMMPARDSDPLGFLDRHALDFPGLTAGFKIIYEDLFVQQLDATLPAWARVRGLKIIHLRRLNPVATLASRLRMQKYRISHSDAEGRPQGGSVAQKVSITPEDLQGFSTRQRELSQRVDALFPDALQLRYETLAEDWPRILAHLDLPGDRPFGASLRKMTPLALSEVIEGYDKIAEYDHPAQPVWS